MESAAFEYELPPEAVAQQPASPRDASKLLVAGDSPGHLLTRDFPSLLRPGDVVVLNDTKVLPARLQLRKQTGGAVEVLALEPVGTSGTPGDDAPSDATAPQWWEALVRPSRRVPDGTVLVDEAGAPVLEVGPATGEGTRLVFAVGAAMEALLARLGALPLPPYINGTLDEPDRYQTVYARSPSSVAAPTAGLHLTDEVIDRCRDAGADVRTVELSVGVGTFRPLEADTLDRHTMHSERYRVPASTWDACARADRVVAVGTTVVRTLESVSSTGRLEGRTDLFIAPGFEFSVVGALLTNFHLPRSTLLVMLEAFMGPGWRDLYETALEAEYRFLSFGDAMFVERREDGGVAPREGH